MIAHSTLSLRGGVGLPTVFHHSPPPLKDPQELRLLHIPAHSFPRRHSSEGLVFHLVLVCRVDGDAWKTHRSVVASEYQWEFPQRIFFFLFYQHSLQLHDGRFPVFVPLVLQEQFQHWQTGSNGRFTIDRTKQAGRLTVHVPSSSCEQRQKNQTLSWSKKTFVLIMHVDGVRAPVFCWQASRRCPSWFSPSFLLLRLPWCQVLEHIWVVLLWSLCGPD